jgi:hypothetical protein
MPDAIDASIQRVQRARGYTPLHCGPIKPELLKLAERDDTVLLGRQPRKPAPERRWVRFVPHSATELTHLSSMGHGP